MAHVKSQQCEKVATARLGDAVVVDDDAAIRALSITVLRPVRQQDCPSRTVQCPQQAHGLGKRVARSWDFWYDTSHAALQLVDRGG